MKTIASLAILLGALTALAQAQGTTIQIQTSGPVAALADTGTQQDYSGVPAGTPVGSGRSSLQLHAHIDQNTYLSAHTLAYPTMAYREGIGCNFFERAYARGAQSEISGSSASPGPSGAQFGPHALLMTFSNQPGTVGKMIFNFRCNPGTTGTVGGSIDIGNDGSIEFTTTQGAAREFPFTFGPSGNVDVKVSNECWVSGTGNPNDFQYAWTEIWTGFLPDLAATCTFTNYGQGCGGCSASAGEFVTGTNRVVTMLVSGAYPSDPVIALLGGQQLNLQLPGGCSLLCTAQTLSLLSADAQGNATQTWTIPVTLTGTTFHQFLPISLQSGSLTLKTSDGIRMDCRL